MKIYSRIYSFRKLKIILEQFFTMRFVQNLLRKNASYTKNVEKNLKLCDINPIVKMRPLVQNDGGGTSVLETLI